MRRFSYLFYIELLWSLTPVHACLSNLYNDELLDCVHGKHHHIQLEQPALDLFRVLGQLHRHTGTPRRLEVIRSISGNLLFSHADGVNSDATILQYNSSDPSTDPGPDSFNGYPAKLDRYVSQSIYLLAFRAKIKR